MLLLRHHRGLDGHDHLEGARSGIHRGFTAVSFAGPGARRSFRASPLAGYINGTNLRIDGGSTAVV
jgi:hypothetical protein